MSEATALVQGTDEWRLARAGSLGASQIHEALARTKAGWGASRANVMAQLIVERLTGQPTEGYMNAAMQWGVDTEAQARSAYQFMRDAEVKEVGLVLHPRICGTHASPDGLVGADGLVEIKCPTSATHIEALSGASLASKYVTQMQWQMACTERAWCDFVSFDPRMPVAMQLYVLRVKRDDKAISELERQVSEFLAEMGSKLAFLRSRYMGERDEELAQSLVASLAAESVQIGEARP